MNKIWTVLNGSNGTDCFGTIVGVYDSKQKAQQKLIEIAKEVYDLDDIGRDPLRAVNYFLSSYNIE